MQPDAAFSGFLLSPASPFRQISLARDRFTRPGRTEVGRDISHDTLSCELRAKQPVYLQYTSPFDDYIDYRLNRKHRGAAVRSVLNQMDLEPRHTKYPPLPITSM